MAHGLRPYPVLAAPVLALAVAAGLATLSLGLAAPSFSRFGQSLPTMALGIVAGWSVVAGGLLSGLSSHRRAAGTGLALTGVTWFVADWANPSAPSIVFTLGLAAGSVWPALLHHATVGWTSPSHVTSARQVLVIASYAISLGLLGIVPALAFDPAAARCTQCPPNLISVTNDPGLVLAATRLGFTLEAGWIALAIVALGAVLMRTPPIERRLAAPLVVPAVIVLGASAIGSLYAIPRGGRSNDSVDLAVWAIQAIGLILVVVGIGLNWLRRRRTRHRVAALALELAAVPPNGELGRVLGAALGDPTLQVRYPVDEERVLDPSGRVVGAAGDPGMTSTVVRRAGVPIAVLLHRPDLAGDTERIGEVVDTVRLALENERLHALRRWRLAELRSSRAEIVAASDAERRRIERDLHDGSQQRVLALALDLAVVHHRAASQGTSTPGLDMRAALEAEVRAALGDLRELAQGIVPRTLSEDGLAPAIEELIERATIPIEVVALPRQRCATVVEAAAYLVIARSTRAPGVRRAALDVRHDDGRLTVDVRLDSASGLGAATVVELEDRCGALDGTVTRDVDRQGRHRIRAEIPCES
jgi:signal transduction histidine kinase